jgi:prevent-host-death family protein
MAWQLQEAKAKFSALVQKALDEGPQTVTRHGKETVVVLSVRDYARLREREPSLKDILMSGPEGDLDLEREPDYGCEFEF